MEASHKGKTEKKLTTKNEPPPPQVYLLTAVPLFSVPQLSSSPVVNHLVILSLPHLLPVAHIGMVRVSQHPHNHKGGRRSTDRAARPPQPPTNQPLGHQMSRPARLKCARFWAKYPNHFGSEQKFWYPLIRKPPRHLVCFVFLSGTAPNWPNLVDFGLKIPKYWATFLFQRQNYVAFASPVLQINYA